MKHIYGNYIYRQFAKEYNFLCVIKKEGKSNLDFSSFLITSKFGLRIVFRVGRTAYSFLEWVLLSYAYIEGFICIWKNKSVSVKFNALQNFVKH